MFILQKINLPSKTACSSTEEVVFFLLILKKKNAWRINWKILKLNTHLEPLLGMDHGCHEAGVSG